MREQDERPPTEGKTLIGILIAILLAAVVYWICMALGLPAIVALIAAVLVLIAGIPTGGYGFGSRFGGRRGTY
jgi:high-affinity Fe2+/Pb2+ permease